MRLVVFRKLSVPVSLHKPAAAIRMVFGQHTCSRRCNVVRTARQVIATRTRLQVVAAALDPDNTSILVCGGAGTAMHTTRKLKDMGAWVWMLQRTDKNRPDIEKMMAFCVKGDAMKPDSIKKAMDGIDDLDAVVSTVGGTVENPESDGQGNINLIEAAAAAGVKKFVLVTSVGTGDSKHAPTPEVYNILKPVLLEKEKAEAALRVCFRNSDQSHQAVASLKDSNLSSFRGLQAFTI